VSGPSAVGSVGIVADIGYGRQFDGWYHRLFPDDASVLTEVERLVALHPDPASGTVEFGVGTGRIALPLSRRVGRVTGVDCSPEMLDVLRQARTDDTPVEPVHADICVYTDDRTVGLVYCVCATLSMLLTPEEQQQAVRRAAELLAPGGRLVIETHNKPAVVELHEGRSRATYFTPYPEPNTGLQSHSQLLPESLWHLAHVWYESDGTTRVGTEVSRLTSPEEMDAYARAAGLEPESRFGDWPADAEPYGPRSPLAICTVRALRAPVRHVSPVPDRRSSAAPACDACVPNS
jgi:SAM-dependent methyltransferase